MHGLGNLVCVFQSLSEVDSQSMSLQKTKLINNIEKLTDGVEGNKKLHHAKQELLYQIKTLDIAFTCQGFFKIDRAFLAEVGLSRRGGLVAIIISILIIGSPISDGLRMVHLHCHYDSNIFYRNENEERFRLNRQRSPLASRFIQC